MASVVLFGPEKTFEDFECDVCRFWYPCPCECGLNVRLWRIFEDQHWQLPNHVITAILEAEIAVGILPIDTDITPTHVKLTWPSLWWSATHFGNNDWFMTWSEPEIPLAQKVLGVKYDMND